MLQAGPGPGIGLDGHAHVGGWREELERMEWAGGWAGFGRREESRPSRYGFFSSFF